MSANVENSSDCASPGVFLDKNRGKNSRYFKFLPRLRTVGLAKAFKEHDTSPGHKSQDALHPAFRQDLS